MQESPSLAEARLPSVLRQASEFSVKHREFLTVSVKVSILQKYLDQTPQFRV
jgi:hypothetical protein